MHLRVFVHLYIFVYVPGFLSLHTCVYISAGTYLLVWLCAGGHLCLCASVLDMLLACVLCAHFYEQCCVRVCECVCITVLLITHLFDNQSCRGQHLPYNSCPIVNAIGKNDIFSASILPSCRSQGRLAHNRSNLRAALARISSMCTLVCVLLCASTLLSSALGLYAATM